MFDVKQLTRSGIPASFVLWHLLQGLPKYAKAQDDGLSVFNVHKRTLGENQHWRAEASTVPLANSDVVSSVSPGDVKQVRRIRIMGVLIGRVKQREIHPVKEG